MFIFCIQYITINTFETHAQHHMPTTIQIVTTAACHLLKKKNFKNKLLELFIHNPE